VDAVIITGGLAHSDDVVAILKPHIEFLGRMLVYPGEGESEALAAGAWRVIDGDEPALEYGLADAIGPVMAGVDRAAGAGPSDPA
jgi:butyrate kinase